MRMISKTSRIPCLGMALLLMTLVGQFCASCAHYHFGSTLPANRRAIEVLPPTNLTSEARLEGMLRNSLAESVMNTPGITLATPKCGEAMLETRIEDLNQSRLARAKLRDRHDRDHDNAAYQTVVFRLTIKVTYRLVTSEDEVLREGELEATADFPTLPDQEIAREEALREAIRSAAAKIVAEVTEG